MGNFGKCFLKVEEDGICLYSIVDLMLQVRDNPTFYIIFCLERECGYIACMFSFGPRKD